MSVSSVGGLWTENGNGFMRRRTVLCAKLLGRNRCFGHCHGWLIKTVGVGHVTALTIFCDCETTEEFQTCKLMLGS